MHSSVVWCAGVLGNKQKKYRVTQLRSVFQESSEQQHFLPKRLQSDISTFSKKRLQNVNTVVKDWLPSHKGELGILLARCNYCYSRYSRGNRWRSSSGPRRNRGILVNLPDLC